MPVLDANRPCAFLWPTGIERPEVEAYVPPSGDWWQQFYRALVSRDEVSAAALRELTASCRSIAGTLANARQWERPSPWKGVVVGAVQSGKTQSMMGVTAIALDAGYRIVVVLAGVKDDLREQTARRFNTQLLLQNDYVPGERGATTLGGSIGPQGNMRAYAPAYNLDCHQNSVLAAKLTASLRAGLPAVIVVKKLPTSLNDLRGALAEAFEEIGPELLPTLILDDECDEATVPGGNDREERAVPEAITNLWQGLGISPRVSYLGYTATAAANLLQHPDWPLYPHFVWLLRYPGSESSDLKFEEPTCDNWYSGGECFYEEFGEEAGEHENFLICPTIEPRHLQGAAHENPSLLDAFRAYFVGGAYRLALEPGARFGDAERSPKAHAMMIHTSAAQEDHSRWLAGVLTAFGERKLAGGGIGFDLEALWQRLLTEEPLWRKWSDRFSVSRDRIYDSRPHLRTYARPTWEDVKRVLPAVFENVRVKVVNSNVTGRATLDFETSRRQDGRPQPPPDVYVVAIGGSRLSRGLTIKGLCVSYFARWAVQRHEDTLQQMSRWFGYRGPYLEFCRVFTTEEAWEGLRDINANDLTLRLRLAQLMRERRDPAFATIVFRASPYVLPTAKLGAGIVTDLTFSPFARVLSDVRYGEFDHENQELARTLIARMEERGAERVCTQSGVQRGVLSRGWTAEEVAAIIEGLKFSEHNPADEANLLRGRFRQCDLSRPACTGIDPASDPYHVAAYLRAWAAHPPPGSPAPRFNVGVSFGEARTDCDPFTIPLVDRQISEKYQVQGSWTGRGPHWPGDYYFDEIPRELRLGKTERAAGSNGLLLLYIVHKGARGRTGRGITRRCHTPFFGISIPAGGPTEIRVVTRPREGGR